MKRGRKRPADVGSGDVEGAGGAAGQGPVGESAAGNAVDGKAASISHSAGGSSITS